MFYNDISVLFSKKGKKETLYVVWDCDPPDPRKREENNLGIMVCFHRRYLLGDEIAKNIEWYSSWSEWFENEVVKPNGGWKNIVAYFPLYMYDHSGLTINTSGFRHIDPYGFDWGQIGYIYTTRFWVYQKLKIKKINDKIKEEVKTQLLTEVQKYDRYLRGEYYGYIVFDNKTGEKIASQYGLPDINEVLNCLSGESRQMLQEFIQKRPA